MAVKLLNEVENNTRTSLLYRLPVGDTLYKFKELLLTTSNRFKANDGVQKLLDVLSGKTTDKVSVEYEVEGYPIVFSYGSGMIGVYTPEIYKNQVKSKYPKPIDLLRAMLGALLKGGTKQGRFKPPNVALRGGVKIPNPVVKEQKPPKELENKTMSNHVKGMDFISQSVRVADGFHKQFKVEQFQRYPCGEKVCLSADGTEGRVRTLEFDPEKWVFVEADLLAAVQPLANGYTLDPEYLPFVNSKAEVIRAKDFIMYYKTHLGSYVFTNHIQDTDKQKGVIIDVVLREEPVSESSDKTVLYSTGLLAVNKKDDPMLCEAIVKGQVRFGSMGSVYSSQTCSYCGKVGLASGAGDTRCIHLKMLKGTYYNMADGTRNRIVEWWNAHDEEGKPASIDFVEYSLLVCKNGEVGGVCEGVSPAFSGAVVEYKAVPKGGSVKVEVPELYLKKPAFQKYLKNGEIKIDG